MITDRVPSDEGPRLDPRHFGEHRHAKTRDDLGIQEPHPAQLADAGHHPVQPPENGHRPPGGRRLPVGDRFESREDLVEAVPQVLGHVVSVEALPMPGVQGAAVPPTSPVPGTKARR